MERKDGRPAPTRHSDETGRRASGMADVSAHQAQVRPESAPDAGPKVPTGGLVAPKPVDPQPPGRGR